jgi:beta-xylosidase
VLALSAVAAIVVSGRPVDVVDAPVSVPVAAESAPAPVVRDLPPADPAAPSIIATPGIGVPNPMILVDEGRYYMYSSQLDFYDPSIELRISNDPLDWNVEPIDALPVIPAWASHGLTWAPDVIRVDDGYVMYMTAQLGGVQPDTQCIGIAVADRPEGPFHPSPDPLVCQRDRNGSIDPRTFVDANGDLWLHWKSDDNADVGGSSRSSVYAQRLDASGTVLEGDAVRIMEVDQSWEGRIVEAPQMVLLEGEYWMFYSGNWFNQPAYALGVARCEGPAGPCTKPLDGPWLDSNDQGAGPGEGSVFTDLEGRVWIAYAPVAQDYVNLTPRPVALGHIGLGPEGPYLAAPG